MRGIGIIILAGSVLATGAYADKPSANELAPLAIPSGGTQQTDFAEQLDKACNAVKAKTGATGSFVVADLGNAKKLDAAIASFKDACDAVNSVHTFTSDDLETLRRFRSDPAGIEASIEKATAGGTGKPQGIE